MVDDVLPVGPTRAERSDFLKQMLAFTEGNIRSFDTKAQISVAAFVLTFPPYWMVASAGCARLGSLLFPVGTLLIYFLTVLLFFHVLWPVRPRHGEAAAQDGVFFIRDPLALQGTVLREKLAASNIEAELASEVIKLAYIRSVKARRFKVALTGAAFFYAVALSVILVTRGCMV